MYFLQVYVKERSFLYLQSEDGWVYFKLSVFFKPAGELPYDHLNVIEMNIVFIIVSRLHSWSLHLFQPKIESLNFVMWFRVLVTEINITWIGGKSLHLVVHGVTISWSQLRSCLLGVLRMKFLAEYKNPTLRTPNKHALILHIWNEDKLPCHEAFRRGFEVGENGKQNWCHIFCCLLLWTKGVFFSSQK